MQKIFLSSGAILGALGVALGAFGAHAFKPMLEATGRLDTFETAVKYQMYHALALLAVGILLNQGGFVVRWLTWSGWGFLVGSIVFAGSLYLICFTGIKAWGAVAPIGGTLLIIGWIMLWLGIWKS